MGGDPVRPRGIVLHTVGVPGDTTAAAIRKYHVEHNGWQDLGYHRVVRKDGTVETGRALWRMGAHTNGANDTLGICVTGDGDQEPWTHSQHGSVLYLCIEWCRHYGWGAEAVCGHREAPVWLKAKPTSKTCPGKLVDLPAFRAELSLALTKRSPAQG